jgi:hypothetical protein
MNVLEALKSRKSVRAFLNRAVEKEKIVSILNTKIEGSGDTYNLSLCSHCLL